MDNSSTNSFGKPSTSLTVQQLASAILTLTRQMKNGASNFYWIAGLSLVNTVLAVINSDTRFVIGLGATQFVDAMAISLINELPQAATFIFAFGLILDVGIMGGAVLTGWLASTGKRWAFIIGMAVYALDALVLMAFQDWIGFGFHLFFLWGIWGGLKALNSLSSLQEENVNRIASVEEMMNNTSYANVFTPDPLPAQAPNPSVPAVNHVFCPQCGKKQAWSEGKYCESCNSELRK